MHRFLRVWLSSMMIISCGTAAALPPLGLTLIDPTSQPSRLAVIDETAYISTSAGVWLVHPSNGPSFTPILHSQFGQPTNVVTRVIKANGNELYLAATFGQQIPLQPVGALFRLDQPSLEIVTWPSAGRLVGVDRNLRTLGVDNAEFVAEYLIDGTVNALGVPLDCPFDECASSQSISDVTESGYATGTVKIRPDAPGSGIGVWDPAGHVTIAHGSDVPESIADRLDGQGYNVSLGGSDGDFRFQFGDTVVVLRHDEGGNRLPNTASLLVTQSDFVVLQDVYSGPNRFYSYYPGIVPGKPQTAADLFEVFPELGSIEIDRISDMDAVDGYLYMTLSGADGTFLFGARDPSVVPEPGGLVLMLLGGLLGLRRSVV